MPSISLRNKTLGVLASAGLSLFVAGCGAQQESTPNTGEQPTMTQISITSPAFEHNSPIPETYSQDGKNVSPALQWDGVPSEAEELVLIMDDPDAPMDQPYVHWVMYAIPPDAKSLPEAIPKGPALSTPRGALQGQNTAGNTGYDGPAPPPGHGVHHYHFKLYALDQQLDIEAEQTKEDVLEASEGHIIAQGELVGTYER